MRSNKQKDRLSVSKARLGSITNQLSQQLGACYVIALLCAAMLMALEAMAKVTGALQKSTEIMKLSNQLIKLPQISQTMREMSMEWTKVRDHHAAELSDEYLSSMQAGILEEMMDDTLAIEEDEEIEEEADAEVDKVLFDLTNGKLGQAGTIQNQEPVRPTDCSPSVLALDGFIPRVSKTNWKTKRQNESWSSIGNSSVACSADLAISVTCPNEIMYTIVGLFILLHLMRLIGLLPESCPSML